MVEHVRSFATSKPIASSEDPDDRSGNEEEDPTGEDEHTGREESKRTWVREKEEHEFDAGVVTNIEAVVEDFRLGKCTKSQAVRRVITHLGINDDEGNNPEKDRALEEYISMLDKISNHASKSRARGQYAINSQPSKENRDDKRRRRYAQSEGNIPNDDCAKSVEELLSEVSKTWDDERERNESESNSWSSNQSASGADSDSAGENHHGRSNKKQRVYESEMPWYQSEKRARGRRSGRDSCDKSRRIYNLFQKDSAAVKRWIKGAVSAPSFPSSEWDALVKGESADIDTVFSSLHHLNSVEQNIGHVGSTEIHFGRPKPAKKVETSGQWTAAYNAIVNATAFLFPHRYDELRAYGTYMEELFSAKSTSIHPRLIKYDAAIRYKVGCGQTLLLTDRAEFAHYYEAIVAPDGAGSSDAGGGLGSKQSRPRGNTKSEICYRFNSGSGCKLSQDKCAFKHICRKCKRSGHGKVDCKVDEGS